MRVTANSSSSVGPVLGSAKVGASTRSVTSEEGHNASQRGALDDNIGRDISFGQTNSSRRNSRSLSRQRPA